MNIGKNLGLSRGNAAVCALAGADEDRLGECLKTLVKHTDAGVPLMIWADGDPDPSRTLIVEQSLAGSSPAREVYHLGRGPEAGIANGVNAALAAAAPADVVIVKGDCIVGEGWLESLREAA